MIRNRTNTVDPNTAWKVQYLEISMTVFGKCLRAHVNTYEQDL